MAKKRRDMTHSTNSIAKLAALTVLAALLCVAQMATLWKSHHDQGVAAKGFEVGLAQVIEWERGSTAGVHAPKNSDDVPAIFHSAHAGHHQAKRHFFRAGVNLASDAAPQLALPGVRAPPSYAFSA